MREKIMLLDGHSLLNRAFYGVPDLSTAQGFHTNAVYGFLNIMFSLLEEEKPEYLAVAFDVKAPTFRHELYPAYKGTRKPMPQELHEQVPALKELLSAMGILLMEKPGLEADDILGTFAREAKERGLQVSLVSGDRDLLQVADENIKIRIPKTKGGKTQIEDYYAKDVLREYRVTPKQFIELKALMGDPSDNIPGVPKVGPKTATELMVQYGSLDNIYQHLEEIAKKSIRQALEENRRLAYLSKALAAIELHADLPYRVEDARFASPYTKEAYALCQKLEFKQLLARFGDAAPFTEGKGTAEEVTDPERAKEIFLRAGKSKEAAFAALEDGRGEGDFAALALCLSEEEAWVFPAGGLLTKDCLTKELRRLSAAIPLITYDVKQAYPYLDEGGRYFDIHIAAYLLNPLKSEYSPADIARERLGLMLAGRGQLFGKKSLMEARAAQPEAFRDYGASLALTAFRAKPLLEEELRAAGMEALFREVEMPLSYVLFSMEEEGIRVEREALREYGQALSVRIAELEKSVCKQAGMVFNLNSPKQLGEALFEKMKLPGGKKTKTGYSTAAEALERLAPEAPIVSDILEYRTLAKLKSTYADGLAACIAGDGRIHTTFNQTITATGRISSTEPNLQNIPMRTELGRLIRKVFVPKEGNLFVDADYSQIELRLLAHLSGDEGLIEAYRSDSDIHRITASQVFHIPLEEVGELQRRNAKAVNFGIVYGISSFGLSQDLSITRKEAADYIEGYFQTYPKVKGFLDGLVAEGKEKGYVTTLFGRRRPLPELKSANFVQRSFGERAAMNAPLQGTAADIIKIAMIRVFRRLRREGLAARLLLQIHDELLIEASPEEAERVKAILEEEMKGAADLAVTLEVDVHTGKNWYEAK